MSLHVHIQCDCPTESAITTDQETPPASTLFPFTTPTPSQSSSPPTSTRVVATDNELVVTDSLHTESRPTDHERNISLGPTDHEISSPGPTEIIVSTELIVGITVLGFVIVLVVFLFIVVLLVSLVVVKKRRLKQSQKSE